MKKVLSNKLYLSLLGLDLLSNFGDALYYLALMTYVLGLPDAKLAIAIITLSESLPMVTGLMMGFVADRTRQKIPTIIATQCLRFGLYLLMGWLIGFSPSLGIVLVAAIINLVSDLAGQYESSLYMPVSLRVVKPEDRQSSMAFSSALSQLSTIVFKFSGAILIAYFSYRTLAFINATTFLICALGMLALTPKLKHLLAAQPIELAQNQGQFWLAFKDSVLTSLKAMMAIPDIRLSMVIVPILNGFLIVLDSLVLLTLADFPDFAVKSPALTLSLMATAMLVGGLLGNLLVMTLFKDISVQPILKALLILLCLLLLSLFWQNLYTFLGLLFLIQALIGMINPKVGAIMKNSLPEDKLATIFGGMTTYFQLSGLLMRGLVAGLILLLTSSQLIGLLLVACILFTLAVYARIIR